MRMDMGLQQKLEQKLKLAPQIIQSIEILQKNITELREHVEQQMLENPTMELDDPTQREEDEYEVDREDPENSPETLERELERLEDIQESWKEIAEFDRRSYSGAGEKDKKMEAMQNAPEREQTLQEHIIDQLHNQTELPQRVLEIGEYLAYNLDDAGYLRTVPPSANGNGAADSLLRTAGEITEDFCAGIPVEPPAEVEEVEEVLHLIQQCEPPGVAARDLKECLLIQLGMDEAYTLERKIVRDHLEDVMKNRLPKIAKATGEPIELVDEAISFIRSLNPQPGAVFAHTPREYVNPDIVVQQIEGEWQVLLEDTYVPHIRISPRYFEMLKDSNNDPKVQAYVRRKIEGAKFLIEAIEQRQQTLRKIAQEIVDYQRDFFEQGVDALRPLKMQYIADRVGVHVSTVSRAISGKYMQTPRGIFSLRYFFKGGTTTDDGEELSIVAIKQKVQALVDNEDKSNPLSDAGIADLLKEQFGLDVARRTVTKYRKALNIPSSRERRRFV